MAIAISKPLFQKQEVLELQILEICKQNVLIEKEQYWFGKFKHLYNIHPNARSGKGVKRTEEFCIKISKAFKGKKFTEAHKAKLRGQKRSLETRERIRASRLGTTLSTETKARIGAAARGHKISEETRTRMSIAQRKRFGSL